MMLFSLSLSPLLLFLSSPCPISALSSSLNRDRGRRRGEEITVGHSPTLTRRNCESLRICCITRPFLPEAKPTGLVEAMSVPCVSFISQRHWVDHAWPDVNHYDSLRLIWLTTTHMTHYDSYDSLWLIWLVMTHYDSWLTMTHMTH